MNCVGRLRTKSTKLWLCRKGSSIPMQSKAHGWQASHRESWRQYHDAGLSQPWTWHGENAYFRLTYGNVCVRRGGRRQFCSQYLYCSFKLMASCLNRGTGVPFYSHSCSRINEQNKKMSENLSLHLMDIVDTVCCKWHFGRPTGKVSYITGILTCPFKALLQQNPEKLAHLLQVGESLMEEEEQQSH